MTEHLSAPGPREPEGRSSTGHPPPAPDAGPQGPGEMSLAEKLACEREARHDVAARRRIADVAPVQHYLSHERVEDARHAPAPHEAARRAERHADRRTAAVPPGLLGWLRWGEEGGPGNPVIPRC